MKLCIKLQTGKTRDYTVFLYQVFNLGVCVCVCVCAHVCVQSLFRGKKNPASENVKDTKIFFINDINNG